MTQPAPHRDPRAAAELATPPTPLGADEGQTLLAGGRPPTSSDEATLILQPRVLTGGSSAATAAAPTSPRDAQAAAAGGGQGGTAEEPGSLPAVGPGAEGPMRQVGRYQVMARLGRGGMATVYRAHDPGIGRDVAIKFLHASLSEDEDCRTRFLREARAAGGLSHPNIVIVHDVGEIERRPFMTMELVEGEPLSELLEGGKSLPVRDAVVIGLQLAKALEYAHGRGIVHRDIKPGNMMRLRGSLTIKVTDFGIAHMDDGDSERTMVGAVMGTPQYMSPEQARGDKIDGRSDLFSAGIVMYQMLTGERPFQGETLLAVATRITQDEPPPVTARRPEVPSALRKVVERCLAKQPARRYQSGQELADALTKVLAEMDEAATERNKRRIVPLRVKWAAAMAALVAVVMGLTTAAIHQRQYAAMMDQAAEYGSSLARFIAKQNAAAVLGDDWDTVDVAVQEIMKTGNFERVSVIDQQGTVRVSSKPALVGKPYRPEGAEALGKVGGITAMRYQVGTESVLGFEAPVTFTDKALGRVALGIPEKPLTQVARLSVTLMTVLAVVTVLAVALAMYFVANWFAKPIRLVSDSMAEIGKGRFDHRIGENRNDEFGELFTAFDDMARLLHQREVAAAAVAPPASAAVPPQAAPPT